MATRPTAPVITPAQAAHPLNRPQTASPATPQPPQPATRVKIAKILKVTAVSVVIIVVIGVFASLTHHSHEIADLKANQGISAQNAQTLKNLQLDYAVKYCGQVAAKGDGPQCIQETLDGLR